MLNLQEHLDTPEAIERWALFIPTGPNVVPSFLADTVESALFHLGEDRLVIIGDDSADHRFDRLANLGPNVVVRQTPDLNEGDKTYSTNGKLFLKKAQLFRELIAEFDFDRLLSLDDDALVLNNRIIDVAETLFASRERPGILGRYMLDHNFQPTPFEAQLEKMRAQISRNPLINPKLISPSTQPRLRQVMRPLMLEAVANGYTMGTSYIGGSNVFSREFLEALANRPEIDNLAILDSPSGDDDLFTVFCYACGFRVYDILTDPPIFHIAWRKLTMSPSDLDAIGASVVHSVRDPEFGGEDQIRRFFRAKRHDQDQGSMRKVD
ncbi:MAG: hypothetical protein IT203_06620 [Fimbriimonadaceae bacterium]|nr:hypothetical protein [Fimbriimonadaceae bacterium]